MQLANLMMADSEVEEVRAVQGVRGSRRNTEAVNLWEFRSLLAFDMQIVESSFLCETSLPLWTLASG